MVLQCDTDAVVERVLELTRIEQVLPRAHDRQEALKLIETRTGQAPEGTPRHKRDLMARNVGQARQ